MQYSILWTIIINNNIGRVVQEECANRLYRVYTKQQYGWWRIITVLLFIKLSLVNVMRMSLGA